jgi:hypothetical protein
VLIPALATPAEYRLLACADALRVVVEGSEANNCRASATTIEVVTSNPLSVTPTLATAAAKTRTITTAGGSMTVTASNGTTFQLVIPKDALLADTAVKLTPVAAVGGLPLSGGLIAAVDMKPEGLRFAKPATLTITPPAGFSVPLGRQVGFGYSGSGKEFHLEPLAMGATIKLKVRHFSTRGVGDGTAADRAAQQERVPTGAEDRAVQRVSDLLAQQRACGCVPAEELDAAERSMLRTWYDESVRPLLSRAETDDTLIERAAGELIAWDRQVRLQGEEVHFARELASAWASFWRGVDNALEKAYVRCARDHDLTQISRMLSISRLAQIMGHTLPADVMALIEKCARFELDVATSLRMHHEEPDRVTDIGPDVNVVDLPIRLVIEETGWRLTGEGALEFVSYTVPPGGTGLKAFTAGLPFKVVRLDLDINLFGPAQQNRTRNISMLLSHGSAAEWMHQACSTCTPITYFVYYSGFAELHANERIAAISGSCEYWAAPMQDKPPPTAAHYFLIRDWETPGGSLFARRTYDRSKPGVTCLTSRSDWVERTTLDLFHTPG